MIWRIVLVTALWLGVYWIGCDLFRYIFPRPWAYVVAGLVSTLMVVIVNAIL